MSQHRGYDIGVVYLLPTDLEVAQQLDEMSRYGAGIVGDVKMFFQIADSLDDDIGWRRLGEGLRASRRGNELAQYLPIYPEWMPGSMGTLERSQRLLMPRGLGNVGMDEDVGIDK